MEDGRSCIHLYGQVMILQVSFSLVLQCFPLVDYPGLEQGMLIKTRMGYRENNDVTKRRVSQTGVGVVAAPKKQDRLLRAASNRETRKVSHPAESSRVFWVM